MNSSSVETARWPRSRWLSTVAIVLLFQIGLVFYLGHREKKLPERPIFRTRVVVSTTDDSAQKTGLLSDFSDPALLALPGTEGFSGPAWLQYPAFDYRPNEWPDQTLWLELDPRGLGTILSRFTATNAIPPPLVADKPMPRLLRYEPNFPNDPVPAQSRVRLEGDLAALGLMTPLAPRSQAYGEILSNTVVQVAVDAGGIPFAVDLLTGSGSKEADDHALELVNAARFRSLPRKARPAGAIEPLIWGRMIFQWHTMPLPSAISTTGQL